MPPGHSPLQPTTIHPDPCAPQCGGECSYITHEQDATGQNRQIGVPGGPCHTASSGDHPLRGLQIKHKTEKRELGQAGGAVNPKQSLLYPTAPGNTRRLHVPGQSYLHGLGHPDSDQQTEKQRWVRDGGGVDLLEPVMGAFQHAMVRHA